VSHILLRIVYGVALLGVAAPILSRAQPTEPCTALPRAGWISWVEVEARLRDRGIRLTQLRISDLGCYDLSGTDTRGDQHVIRMHPVSGQIMQQKQVNEQQVRLPWRSGFKTD
jgi:hypothetical protein